MPSSTSVRLTVRGTDQTRAMLAGIRARLGLFASQVRAAGAAAASGLATGLAVSTASAVALTTATVAAARAFGRLSDRAAQAGTTADELDRLAAALSVAGAKNANIETVSDALARMTKTTGAAGVAGFRETLATIAAIGDEGARVQELSRVFGRAFGPSMAAFVRQGPDALRRGLDGVMGDLSSISDRAVSMGDEIADGFDIAKRGVLRAGQTLLVEIAGKVFGGIGKSARAVGVLVSEYATVYGELALANVGPLWDRIKAATKNLKPLIKSTLKLILADVEDFVRDVGEKLGLIMAAIAAFHVATGNLAAGGLMAAKAAALAVGLHALEKAADDARASAAEEQEKIREIFADARPFVGLTDAQKKRLDDAEKKAAEINEHMKALTSGSAGDSGDSLADNVAGALAPLRDARAILANTYEAFKIGRQGATGGTPTDRATLDTAKNTAALARNSERQLRATEKLVTALDSGGGLLVLP